MKSRVDIPLLPKQREFMKAALDGSVPHVCYRGGLGSGKTYGGVLALIVLAMMFSGTTWVYCAKTYPQLRDAVLPEFRTVMMDLFAVEDYHWSKTDKTASFTNGSRLLFRSADASESLKSTNPDGILFEEVTDWSQEDFERVYARARSTGAGEPRRMFVYNPRPGWFQDKVDGWVRSGSGVEFVAPTTENIYLPDSYAANLIETYGGPDSALVKRMVLGENARFDGLVYPFDRAVHVMPASEFPFKPGMERVEGLDFGWHNFAWCMVAKWGDSRVVVAEYKTGKTKLADHAAAIEGIRADWQYVGPDCVNCWADHDAQDRAELNRCGLETRAAKKDVLPGIQTVFGHMSIQGDGRPRLYVLDTCPKIIAEFERYEWQEGKDAPVKENDHLMDALRYALHSDSMTTGDSIIVDRGRG